MTAKRTTVKGFDALIAKAFAKYMKKPQPEANKLAWIKGVFDAGVAAGYVAAKRGL